MNEYPPGTTSRTSEREQPSDSIFCIKRGRTDSDEDVPMTMKISSRMNRKNFQSPTPLARSSQPRIRATKTAHVRYMHTMSLPSAPRPVRPNLPTVNASAAKAARGASLTIKPIIFINAFEMGSSSARTGRFASPSMASPRPKSTEKKRT